MAPQRFIFNSIWRIIFISKNVSHWMAAKGPDSGKPWNESSDGKEKQESSRVWKCICMPQKLVRINPLVSQHWCEMSLCIFTAGEKSSSRNVLCKLPRSFFHPLGSSSWILFKEVESCYLQSFLPFCSITFTIAQSGLLTIWACSHNPYSQLLPSHHCA